MSLARAFTTRKSKTAENSSPFPQRSLTTKLYPSGTIRHKISGPVELLSTTNMLSYTAPDLYPTSSSSSSVSGDESDSVPSLTHSPGGSTHDSSSVGTSPDSPEPNHLSCYFSGSRQSSSSAEDAPTIPKRALSHTKRSHEILHRKRSISRMSSQRKASTNSFTRDSVNMFSTNSETAEPHPFGNELAQVTELAEEYGHGRMQVIDEEEQELLSRGLFKFGANDYLDEIQGLFMHAFGDARPTAMWI